MLAESIQSNNLNAQSSVITVFHYRYGKIEGSMQEISNRLSISKAALCNRMLDRETCSQGIAMTQSLLDKYIESNPLYAAVDLYHLKTGELLPVFGIDFLTDMATSDSIENVTRMLLANEEEELITWNGYTRANQTVCVYSYDSESDAVLSTPLPVPQIAGHFNITFTALTSLLDHPEMTVNGLSLCKKSLCDDIEKNRVKYMQVLFYDFYNHTKISMRGSDFYKKYPDYTQRLKNLLTGKICIFQRMVCLNYERTLYDVYGHTYTGNLLELHQETGVGFKTLANIVLNPHLCICGLSSSKEALASITDEEKMRQLTLYHGSCGELVGSVDSIARMLNAPYIAIRSLFSSSNSSWHGWCTSRELAEIRDGKDGLILYHKGQEATSPYQTYIGLAADIESELGISEQIIDQLLTHSRQQYKGWSTTKVGTEGRSVVKLSSCRDDGQPLELVCLDIPLLILRGSEKVLSHKWSLDVRELNLLKQGIIEHVWTKINKQWCRFALYRSDDLPRIELDDKFWFKIGKRPSLLSIRDVKAKYDVGLKRILNIAEDPITNGNQICSLDIARNLANIEDLKELTANGTPVPAYKTLWLFDTSDPQNVVTGDVLSLTQRYPKSAQSIKNMLYQYVRTIVLDDGDNRKGRFSEHISAFTVNNSASYLVTDGIRTFEGTLSELSLMTKEDINTIKRIVKGEILSNSNLFSSIDLYIQRAIKSSIMV